MIRIGVTVKAEKVKLLLERAPEELRAAIELGSAKLLSAMQQTAVGVIEKHTPYPAVAFGNLARGIDFEVATRPPLGGLLFVKPPADTYALPMETGTRPDFPPTAALLPWVLKKFPGADETKGRGCSVPAARKMGGVPATAGLISFKTRAAHE